MNQPHPLLAVDGLSVEFRTPDGRTTVVDDVSFTVEAGSVVGLVGESGSGKTVTCSSILRLIPSPPGRIAAGSIRLDGADLVTMSHRALNRIRGREIAMIFQEPMTSLNPSLTVGHQISEAVRRHLGASRTEARRRAIEVLDLVGIPRAAERVRQYPHEFSGGMRQRVMIAMAISTNPRLLIADEPTTALDVTIQAQILDLLRELASELTMGILLVTHDLGVVADLCDKVVVMYAGQVVEQAGTRELFTNPNHPYTADLMRARPSVEGSNELFVIPGRPPLPTEFTVGCRFADRCSHAQPECSDSAVKLTTAAPGRLVRCARADVLDLRGSHV
ncbi:ABC transporter ATP-binding protein [Nocardioides sp. Bht2]|uniref:ABC transporter ATP-binding protein n=1 Tax=Nocardioides sp. Bht2 TaxID=3392297 RepID=UPI0039B57617